MQWACRALFKIHLHRHHFTAMGKNTARHAVPQIVKRGLVVENKHIVTPECIKTMFHLIYITMG